MSEKYVVIVDEYSGEYIAELVSDFVRRNASYGDVEIKIFQSTAEAESFLIEMGSKVRVAIFDTVFNRNRFVGCSSYLRVLQKLGNSEAKRFRDHTIFLTAFTYEVFKRLTDHNHLERSHVIAKSVDSSQYLLAKLDEIMTTGREVCQ